MLVSVPHLLLTSLLSLSGHVAARLPDGRLSANHPPLHALPRVTKLEARDVSPVTDVNGTEIPPYDTVYEFDQLIDHSDTSKGTFKVRYWTTWEYYKPGGPIILTTPGAFNADGTSQLVLSQSQSRSHNALARFQVTRYSSPTKLSTVKSPNKRVAPPSSSNTDSMVHLTPTRTCPSKASKCTLSTRPLKISTTLRRMSNFPSQAATRSGQTRPHGFSSGEATRARWLLGSRWREFRSPFSCYRLLSIRLTPLGLQ